MELPTSRELELETLLRQRDQQLVELTDEVTQLRQFLVSQPESSTTDPVTLPPALVSVILPHLSTSWNRTGVAAGSNTVIAALTQRMRLLQEENDELYDILKSGETGKLKEEVVGLRRVVERLEGTLRESHEVINILSNELEKSCEALISSARLTNNTNTSTSFSRSPRNSYHPNSHSGFTGNGHSSSKLPPTGPRAHKKPRLSDAQASPPPRSNNTIPSRRSHSQSRNTSRTQDARGYNPRRSPENRGKLNHVKMEVEEDQKVRLPSPQDRDRERDRGRDRERALRDRDRDRERDRDGNRAARRNGNFGGGGSRAGPPARRAERVSASHDSFPGGDRTLAERMGL